MTRFKIEVKCEKDEVPFFNEDLTIENGDKTMLVDCLVQICGVLKEKLVQALRSL